MPETEKEKKVTVPRHFRVSQTVNAQVQELADQYEIDWGTMARIILLQGLGLPLPPPFGHGEEE